MVRIEHAAGSNTRDGGSSAARGNAGVYRHPVEFQSVKIQEGFSSTPLSDGTVGFRCTLAHLQGWRRPESSGGLWESPPGPRDAAFSTNQSGEIE